MSKELEAFERLCSHLDYDTTDYMFNGQYEEDNEVIETALKRNFELERKNEMQQIGLKTKSKKEVALEIIKEHFKIAKPVGVSIEKNTVGVGSLIQIKDLTIEEYELLKEVLL